MAPPSSPSPGPTPLLYMGSPGQSDIGALAYVREFEASVVRQVPEGVVLDRTAFYPTGGGQPHDTGSLSWPSGEVAVLEVTKARSGEVLHRLAEPRKAVPPQVRGALDWARRYAHMRMHTVQHLVSGLVYERYRARTVGNQLYADRSRIDFAPLRLTDEAQEALEAEVNAALIRDLPVQVYYEQRAALEARVSAERANLDLVPRSVTELRIVEIEGYDLCPCAGTHVRRVGEVGQVRILGRENKGKDRERLTYELLPAGAGTAASEPLSSSSPP